MKVAVKQKLMSHNVSRLLVHCSQQLIIHSAVEMTAWLAGGGLWSVALPCRKRI